MSPTTIELKILDPRLEQWGLPRYQSDMAAAIDLHACLDAALTLMPQAPAQMVATGIALHMGISDMAALILPRSGQGHRGLVLGNLVGLIDADYQGPLMVSAWNRSDTPMILSPGDRFAQLVFVPIRRPLFEVVKAFSCDTLRGTGGFGSTGLSAHGEGNLAKTVPQG